MDPFTILLALGAASKIAGGVYGYLKESGSAADADRLIKLAQSKYGGLNAAGIEAAAKEMLPPTVLSKIQVDPSYRQIQREALASLRNVAANGGLDLADRAALNDIQSETNANLTSQRASTLENMKARGTLGSGAELASALVGQQGAAQRQNKFGLQVAGMAQRRALDAMRQSGDLAGQMHTGDYNEKANAARAQDQINRMQWDRNYNAAQDKYARDLSVLERNERFANQQAGRDQAQAGRTANMVRDTTGAAGDALAGAYGWHRQGGSFGGGSGGSGSAGDSPAAPDYSSENAGLAERAALNSGGGSSDAPANKPIGWGGTTEEEKPLDWTGGWNS